MGSKPITLSRAVDLYFRSDDVRQRSRGTQEQHRRTLSVLVQVCGSGRSVNLMTADDFSRAIDLLRHRPSDIELAAMQAARVGPGGVRRGRSEVSLNIDRSVLRKFVRFLHAADHLSPAANPASCLASARSPRTQSHKRQPMLREAVIALLNLAGEYHPRERIAVALATLAGLRESEIQGLQWRDVMWHTPEGPVLDYWRPKGRDSHTVTVIPQLERELRAWHTFYAARHPEMRPSWYVVPARKRGNMPGGRPGHRMTPDWPLLPDQRTTRRLRPTIKPLMAKAGVTDLYGKGMHTLRRTYANMLMEETDNIRIVQTALGHKSQLTTEIYLDRDRDREAAAAAMRNWDPFKPKHAGNVIPFDRKRDAS